MPIEQIIPSIPAIAYTGNNGQEVFEAVDAAWHPGTLHINSDAGGVLVLRQTIDGSALDYTMHVGDYVTVTANFEVIAAADFASRWVRLNGLV